MRNLFGLIARSFTFVQENADKISYVPGALLNVRVNLIILRGKLHGHDMTVDILYAGRCQNLTYLKRKILSEPTVLKSEKTNLFSLRSKIKQWERQADIVFLDVGWPYNGLLNKSGGYLEIPDWISMIVPIEKDWETIEQRFNKTTRKQIRRMDYQFEASDDPDVIARFYDDFYVPFVRHRHDADVIFESRKSVEKRARQGKVLRVLDGDEAIVSGIVYFEDDVLYFLWIGLAEKYLSTPPPAALMAIYYYCLRYAFDNGFKAANWLGTRGFPTDGVFQFKRRWGARIDDSFTPNAILIKPAQNSVSAAKFLEAVPLLVRRNGRLQMIFGSTAETCGDKDIRGMMSNFACGGIDQIKVVHVVEGNASAAGNMPSQEDNLTVSTTTLENFSKNVLEI